MTWVLLFSMFAISLHHYWNGKCYYSVFFSPVRGTFTFTFTTILIDGAAYVILVRSINAFRVSIIINVFAFDIICSEVWVRPCVVSIEWVRLFVPSARPHSNCRWLKWAQWPLTIGQGKLGNERFSICMRFLFCDWPKPMAQNYVHKLASSTLKGTVERACYAAEFLNICRVPPAACVHACVDWANRKKYLLCDLSRAYMRRTENVRIPTAKQRVCEMKMWYFSLLLIHIIVIRAM